MSKKSWTITLALATAFFGVATLVSFVMGGCSTCIETTSGACVPMHCHYAFIASGFICIAGAVASAVNLPGFGASAHRALAAVELSCAALCAGAIGAIGICSSASMHCHQTLHVVLSLLAAAAVVAVVQLAKANPKDAAKPKMRL
ncbi:MAG: hypothetical protein SOI38_01135 [Eggerthellaceae bacterium]|jgi:hypothetical protein